LSSGNPGAATTPARSLTNVERDLARWLLEHGAPGSQRYLAQLDAALATAWRCPCGCASFNLQVDAEPVDPAGAFIVADFLFDAGRAGVFVFQKDGLLAGIEVCGHGIDAPATLPGPGSLRPWDDATPE
jgi:hypothetical protein